MKRLLFTILALLCGLLFSAQARAEYFVTQLLDHQHIEVEWRGKGEFPELKKHDRLIVLSRSSKKVVGYVQFDQMIKGSKKLFKGLVMIREDNGLILPGDEVKKVNLKTRSKEFPGRIDLVVKGRQSASARFKPLVYQGGTLGETAETLDKNEHMIDMALVYFYGISNRWSVATWIPLNFRKQPNIRVKWKIVDNKWFVISQSFGTLYSFRSNKGFFNQLTTNIDVPTNTKFTSHTQIKISFDPQIRLKRSRGGAFGQSTIQTGYQYVFDNWDRLLYGPVYNFDTNAVGGYVSYVWIFDYTHVMFTLQTQDITQFRFDIDEAFFPSLYLYWRF